MCGTRLPLLFYATENFMDPFLSIVSCVAFTRHVAKRKFAGFYFPKVAFALIFFPWNQLLLRIGYSLFIIDSVILTQITLSIVSQTFPFKGCVHTTTRCYDLRGVFLLLPVRRTRHSFSLSPLPSLLSSSLSLLSISLSLSLSLSQ